MKNFKFREIDDNENFDPRSLCEDVPFTQASFYGDWQRNLDRNVRRFLINDGDKTIAYFQLVKYPLLLGKSYFYIPYGPIIKDFSEDFFANLKQELKRIAKAEDAVFVRLDFTPPAKSDILSKFFTKASLYTYHSAYFQPRMEWFLSLKKSENGLLVAMHEKARYSIRLAERKEITAEIITGNFEKFFEIFYELMAGTAKRNGFSLHQKDYYKNIFQNLHKINSYLSIARYCQKILAIDLVIVFGKIANYVFGGSSNEERNRMPTYLAQWKAICYAKQLNCDYYNFGGISTENKIYKSWDGLTIFKKKFGGKEVRHSDFFDVVVNPFWYHYFVALFATLYYGFPSKKMIVIGVTGTKGKTSTINFIWSCLMAGGYKTGIISTANIRIGEEEFLNKYHMTMPGRFTIQKLMAQMVKNDCRFCIVETTSEGIKQYRHIGVYYDIAVFTNLSPEHLEAHGGSFEKYKQMKAKMFATLSSRRKVIAGKEIEKIIIANKDSEHADYFLNFKADKKITFALKNKADYVANSVRETNDCVSFEVAKVIFKIGILGKFNVYNALPAIVVCRLIGMSDYLIAKGLLELRKIPGRMEKIEERQNFTVIVDYAHEKESITNILQTVNNMKKTGTKIIILLGGEGGGRDKAKRPIMGELAARMADYVIVSNVDPYDDDPKQILEDIAVSSEKFGKIRDQNLFVIEDRRLGIRKALSLAKVSDIVLITGKGAEQSIVIGGKSSSWDDRRIVREELKLISSSTIR